MINHIRQYGDNRKEWKKHTKIYLIMQQNIGESTFPIGVTALSYNGA